MDTPLPQLIWGAGVFFILGAILVPFWELLQAILIFVHAKKLFRTVLESVFLALLAPLMMLWELAVNYGELRFFHLASAVLSFWILHRTMGKWLRKIFLGILSILNKLIFVPIKKLIEFLGRKIEVVSSFFGKIRAKLTFSVKNTLKPKHKIVYNKTIHNKGLKRKGGQGHMQEVPPKKKIKNRKSILLRLALFAFAVYVVVAVTNQQVQIRERKQELDQLNHQVQVQEIVNDEIRHDLSTSSQSDDYVERVARESLSLAKPGERIFVCMGGES